MFSKLRRNRTVFGRCRNTCSDGAEVTSTGKPFQMQAPAIGEALAPTVDKRYDGTTSWSVDDDLSLICSLSSSTFDAHVSRLLVWHQEDQTACQWVLRCCCWCSYLSPAKCKWFAYGRDDATAAPSPCTSSKYTMVNYLSHAGSPGISWKIGR